MMSANETNIEVEDEVDLETELKSGKIKFCFFLGLFLGFFFGFFSNKFLNFLFF